MNTIPFQTLASDKLYLLAYIKQRGMQLSRRDLLDAILAEGRMNYFFLCQYLTELIDANFLVENGEELALTEEGSDALAMFSDHIDATDVASLQTESENVEYHFYEENENRIYEKVKNGEVIFSLAFRCDLFDLDLSALSPEEIVENFIESIKKSG